MTDLGDGVWWSDAQGYIQGYMPPMKDGKRLKVRKHKQVVRQHRLVMERHLGRPLSSHEEIHHIDGDKQNNSIENLVLCRDRAHHALLDRQRRALAACGDENWLKCNFCKRYDAPENITVTEGKSFHPVCKKEYEAAKWSRDRERRSALHRKWRAANPMTAEQKAHKRELRIRREQAQARVR